MSKLLNTLGAAVVAFGFSALAASAALVDAPIDCAEGGVAVSLDGSYDSCEGAFLGNIDNQDVEDEINGLFGSTGTWTLLGKDGDGTGSGGVKLTSGVGASTGTFSVEGISGDAVFGIKSANCFSLYYYTGISGPNITGSFDTSLAGLRSGGGNDCDGANSPKISHLNVYVNGEMPVIPLPAAGLLLLGGLGGLAGLRRMKSAA